MPTAHYGVAPPDYRLPDATAVGGVTLQVSNLERSRVFYTEILGLQVIEDARNRVSLGEAGGTRSLVRLSTAPGVQPIPRNGRLGLYHFALLVPSRQALGRFVVHLASLDLPFSSADHLVSEAIYLWDPDGLGIEVYADRAREMWRVNSGELVMATNRLELAPLVTLAGRNAWNGMPAGTTMGHVHLSVGDLTIARNFYHVALGLDATVWRYPGALFLSAGGYHHHLGTNTWSATAPAASETDARLLEWMLVLPEPRDVLSATLSLQNAGYDVETIDDDRVIVDPWGTALRLTTSNHASKP
jgi:catechol 2,3-dioxygenase